MPLTYELITYHWDTQFIDIIYFFVSRENGSVLVSWDLFLYIRVTLSCVFAIVFVSNFFKFITYRVHQKISSNLISDTHSWQEKVSFCVYWIFHFFSCMVLCNWDPIYTLMHRFLLPVINSAVFFSTTWPHSLI
jgi:hypothetical protein